ncbi:hypothetical protein J2125_004524 [Erwinia toletana]|uniref:Uncharacterized protein n=1 Tax=Winslowiella toletana TaxID=92490 RepID=A0ABS4PFB7_9GAMM|nr:hypothetical protein [Winslowiella toletana]MBP2171332.1 hypothetical protein [Winslowiella toletana]
MTAMISAVGLTPVNLLKTPLLENTARLIKNIINCTNTLIFMTKKGTNLTVRSYAQENNSHTVFMGIKKIEICTTHVNNKQGYDSSAKLSSAEYENKADLQTVSFPDSLTECKIDTKEIEKMRYLSSRNKLLVELEKTIEEKNKINMVQARHIRLENKSYLPCNKVFASVLSGLSSVKHKRTIADVKSKYGTIQKKEILSILESKINSYSDEIGMLNFKLKRVHREIYTNRQNMLSPE